MDSINYWKEILLQWIEKCNFLDKTFYNIEQSDIELFFLKFKDKTTGIDCEQKDIISFLTEHYPLFEPHLDDENALSSSDYVYVYSLLLQFSCVKYPNDFFQKNCQRLNGLAQENITTFLTKLLDADSITKECLRHAIASITLFVPASTRLTYIDSPMRTPRKTDISPPTPRSYILQERNKELQTLKVQLENEVYEKCNLETEVKRNQEKISKLNEELKKSRQEIQNLKNDLISGTVDSTSEGKYSEDEQENRRLRKQISQKESEIAKQSEDIDTLTEEKDILTEKLNRAEKQMKIYKSKIEELALKVDQLTGEIEQKDTTIQYLSETKLDLEHYISEIRSLSASSRPDFNTSVECLDLSRTTNSSGSINSPENLGCYVVDIQLREKESENIQLREEINSIRLSNAKLSQHISELTVRYSKYFDICNENLIIDQENRDPVENFIVFSNYVEKFVTKYEETYKASVVLKENAIAIEEQNKLLSNKINVIESEVNCLKMNVNEQQINNQSLQNANESLEQILNECKNKLDMYSKERLEMIEKSEALENELEIIKIEKANSEDLLEQQIKDLKNNYELRQEQVSTLETNLSKNATTLETLKAKMITGEMNNKNLISQIERLNNEKANMVKKSDFDILEDKLRENSILLVEYERKFEKYEAERQRLETEIGNIRSQNSSIKNEMLEKILTLESNLKEKESLINERESEKNALVNKLKEIKQRIDCLSSEKMVLLKEATEYKTQIMSLKTMLSQNNNTVHKLIDDKNQLNSIILQLQADKKNLIDSVEDKICNVLSTLDCCENSLAEKLQKDDEILAKLSRSENDLIIRQSQLEDIYSKYNKFEEALSERTKSFANDLAELKTTLEAVIKEICNETVPTDSTEIILFSVPPEPVNALDAVKQCLNVLIQNLKHITMVNKENNRYIAHLSESVQTLEKQKNNLDRKLIQSEQQNLQMREDFENELQCEKSKLTNEIRRLTGDISNLDKVCDRSTEANSSLQQKLSELKTIAQKLDQENRILKEKMSHLETERENHLFVADKLANTESGLRIEMESMQLFVKKLEADIEAAQELLTAKTRDAELLRKERDDALRSIDLLRKQSLDNHDTYDQNIKKQCEKLNIAEAQLDVEIKQKCKLKEELEKTTEHLNELKKQKTNLDSKCQFMETQLENFRNDLDVTKTELIRLQYEETKLLAEITLLKKTQCVSEGQIEKCNNEIVEQKENLSQLIKELASIRREKDCINEEKLILIKRLEEETSTKHSCEASYKLVEDKLQATENDLLVKQNVLHSEQLRIQDLDNQLKKLQLDNLKLKESSENYMKRMEKQALKLGETQALSSRLKKEADEAIKNLDTFKSSTEIIQRENCKLNLECKSLKEKLFKCEKSYEEVQSKLQMQKNAHESLCLEKENLEVSEKELKYTNATLERSKANLEDKVRKLAKSLSDLNLTVSRLEEDKVRLTLEVGALNTELQGTKSLLSMTNKELLDIKNSNKKLEESNEELQVDLNEIREVNSRLNDDLSKLSLRLKITQDEHTNATRELELLQDHIDLTKSEKDAIEKEHLLTMERLKEFELKFNERSTNNSELDDKIKTLQNKLREMSLEFQNLEDIRKQEKFINEKLNTDVSILQAKLQKSRLMCDENEKKWSEEKEQLLIDLKASDERIKETRLELEGKLDKMKNKMKTLYNEEVTKMKKKHEREVVVLKSEKDALATQNKKYEEHVKKISSQIIRLNENILEYQKQNTFLKTKLNDLESKPRQVNRLRGTTAQSSTHQVLSSNLRMEDEEGEIFNNTYLSDLKDGRMSEHFSSDICPQELQYRNSLLPPHLKSTYLAQFDHQMGEDEIRETPGLDDSLSTLLNTGQRKKVSGATSYKRPGPPTPSKNAGRLSFGGTGEPNREILKESVDTGHGPSFSKTPARFKLFSSKHNIKDECKNVATTFKNKQHILGAIQCSSTPRKSKAHFDQRRLLDQIMLTAVSPGPDDSICNLDSPFNPPAALKTSEWGRRVSKRWRKKKVSCAITDSGTSDVSPVAKDVKFENGGKRSSCVRKRRSSIYFKGSIFARNYNTANSAFREVFRKKTKMQRNATFNKCRDVMSNQLTIKSDICTTLAQCNNDTILVEDLNINSNVTEELKESNLCSSRSMTQCYDGKNNVCLSTSVSDDVNDGKTRNHFYQLLTKKESRAPFKITEINNSPLYSNSNVSTTVHARTIYGSSVILNRRIPNVNTTLVRKSSIYVKANEDYGIILVTNQTITLMDLAKMWIQMNVPAKIVIALFLIILCGATCFLLIKLFF